MAQEPPSNMGNRRAVFVPDHKSFAELLVSDQIRDVTAEVAGDIAKLAAATSARGDGPGPHMADQWDVVENAGVRKVGRNVRVRVDVINPNIAASAQEFGSGPRRGQRRRTLARAASRFGDFHDHGEGAT